ncbi:MAG: M56 family metallopeptidase [Candidatus Dormibacteria bacterium]
MTRRRALWIGFAALALGGCSVPLHAIGAQAGGLGQVAALIGVLAAACALRMAWLLTSAARTVGAMPSVATSERVRIAGGRAGIARLTVVDSAEIFALCSGPLYPRVVVSSGLAHEVSPNVLDAILVHEAHHARRREPLRRAVLGALADVFLPLPVLRWWADRQIQESELAADRAAITRVGAESVAAAMVVVGAPPPRVALAAFGGTAELRAAQLLGEPLPERRLPLHTLIGSLAGLGLLATAALCTSQVVG